MKDGIVVHALTVSKLPQHLFQKFKDTSIPIDDGSKTSSKTLTDILGVSMGICNVKSNDSNENTGLKRQRGRINWNSQTYYKHLQSNFCHKTKQ